MNEGRRNVSTIKSKTIQKLLIAIIFIVFVVFVAKKNVLEKNRTTFVQKFSLVDDIFTIEEVFQRRKKILERSCSFIEQLNTANRIATVNELKEIHLLLQDLKASNENIAKKLQSYEETEILLHKTQESFLI